MAAVQVRRIHIGWQWRVLWNKDEALAPAEESRHKCAGWRLTELGAKTAGRAHLNNHSKRQIRRAKEWKTV